MPFESDTPSYSDVNNVQLCAYRPAPLDTKFSSGPPPTATAGTVVSTPTGGGGAGTPTSGPMPQRCAVEVSRVCLSYGRGASVKPVLNSISLNVPEAGIYGLLGPSGCGKTTLLRCIVGRIKPEQGHVRVFGHEPNSPQSQIPGPSVGYMPQEVAVYEEFTIEEMLYYFGKLYDLERQVLKERIQFLISFLDLPNKNRLVKQLSGGQKRRVSLAAALVHSPPLLILDEPTVGVDPLLRQSIWNHLVTLTRKERITVIVTTHYIEEARQANVVGLMRQGRLLAENSPDALMAEYALDTLEDVFLKLCMSDVSIRAAQLANYTVHSLPAGPPGMPNGQLALVSPPPPHHHHHHHHNHSHHLSNHHQHLTGHVNHAFHHLPAHDPTATSQASTTTVSPSSSPSSPLALPPPPPPPPSSTPSSHGAATPSTTSPSPSSGGVAGSDNITTEQYNQIAHNGDLKNIIKFPSVFSLYITNKEASYDLTPVSGVPGSGLAGSQVVTNTPTINGTGPHHLSLQMNGKSSQKSSTTSYGGYVPYAKKSADTANTILESWASYTSTVAVLGWKNFTRLRRNKPLLLFQFLLPAIQVILFCLCIGQEPFDINVAVVNEENPPYLSKLFLNKIDPHAVRQHNFSDLDSALDAVRRGDMWGVLHLSEKFSVNLQKRVVMGEDVDNETIEASTIRIYPDLTNQQISFSMEKTFREAFQAFAQETLNLFGQNPALAETPIALGTPVYGDLHKQGYLEYMAPGVVVSICYIMATGLTSLAFITERRDGLFERSLVAGVDTMQILFSHALVQISVMSIQILLVLIFTFLVFDIPSRGPFLLVVLLLVFQGATGMAFGLVVSAFCKQENTAIMMILGSFYPNLILSGIIWPLEAMPHWIRTFSYFQPQTLPTETLRNILSRGWSMVDHGVWIGFVVTGSWFFIYIVIAAVVFKIKK